MPGTLFVISRVAMTDQLISDALRDKGLEKGAGNYPPAGFFMVML